MNLRGSPLGWAVAAAVVVLAGCGRSTGTVGTPPPSRPTGASDVVVQVTTAGGNLPPDVGLGAVPGLTVLGDGTVITPAPVPAIYPGPALAPLQAARVDGATVDGLVRKAGELGLLGGPLQFGRPAVMDAPDTIVTITAGGTAHRHVVYALGINDGLDGGRPAGGVSRQEAANRGAIKTFLTATEQLPPGRAAWTPAAVAVYVLGDYSPDPTLPQPAREWPLARPPATTGAPRPCTLVEGADLAALLDALSRANARTPWVIGGRPLAVAFRPVLPGEAGCGP